MLFTDLYFFILLVITFALFYSTRNQKFQTGILIVSSFIFYAWNFPSLLLILLFSITINVLVTYSFTVTKNHNLRRLYAILGVAANLAFLSFFKYGPLLGRTFFGETSSVGQFLIAIPLPIGISFFTFQGISLVVDAFTKKELDLAESYGNNFGKYIINVSLFKAFFPQLIAGPIVKAHDFLPQVSAKLLSGIDWEFVFKNLVTGYFLKMVIADNLKDHTFWLTFPYFTNFSGLGLVTMLLGYSMQIFADFAGYSLIALGLAALFGYQLRDNFLFPYISTSFSEFWRRWHISLSTFLKEYLYIPLGGNRKGKIRTYFNLMITMALGGLWHGAAWSYAVWGIYHGVLLAIERLFTDIFKMKLPDRSFSGFGRFSKPLLVARGVGVFTLVSFGWLLFKMPEFSYAVQCLKQMFISPFWIEKDIDTVFFIAAYSIPVIIYHFLYLYKENASGFAHKNLKRLEPIFYGTMLFLLISNSGSSGSFIYFQF